jgi:hypothetical protein
MPRYADYLPDHESDEERELRLRDFAAQRREPPELTIVWVACVHEPKNLWVAAVERREVTGSKDEVVAWALQQPADRRLIMGAQGWEDLETGEPFQEDS